MRHPIVPALLGAVFFLGASTAAAQVAPRITIAVDTSGSMALDMNGIPTFGDGVLDGCTRLGSGQYCGTDCRAGIDTDCDGQPNDSRMFIAKEAIRNMVLSTGDVEWAMSRFDQNHDADVFCNVRRRGVTLEGIGGMQDVECTGAVSSYGNPQCNTGTARNNCGGGLVNVNDWPAACRPGSGGNPALRELVYLDAADNSDGNALTNPQLCFNYEPGNCDAASRSGDLLVGFPDMGAYVGMTNVFGILKWIDNTETSFNNNTTVGDFCRHSTTGDCELFPIGRTPLEGILRASRDYMVSVRAGDSAIACRPYSIILITDGVETCLGNPAARAGTILSADGIRTYVIGMSIASSTDRATLNSIAVQGGTSAAFFADNPDTLAAALSDIVADSLLIEVCNNLDDNCNGLIDEGFNKYCNRPAGITATTLCDDPGETVCDGVDDNCNGLIDEGLTNACGGCGPVPVEICDGIDNDCDGIIDEGDVCAGCTPTTEICDGIDNDCDGLIDESLSRPCGTDVGVCTVGTQTCTAGAWGACTGTGPSAEICDGLDNDCDGVIDGMTRPCGTDVGACSLGTELCTAGGWGSCTGGVGPSMEICDGIDNDCDGSTDEGDPGGGGSCGSSIGACTPGTIACLGGSLVCTGGTSPMPEICDGIDNDCDGSTDEGVPSPGPCGSGVGECREGALTCVGGSFTCVGGRGPTTEVCDGRDNDCDGATDEGNPGGGVSCGTDVGSCTPGTSRCVGGSLVCEGGTPPGVEICDGIDNDCDGLVDEGNPGGGGPCGATDVGECELGTLACVGGALVCRGEVGPRPERCDGLDNDCDGMIDEGNPEGGDACGDDTGECTPGTTLCVGGTLICDGGTGPTAEICNGLDDDCDGVVDDGLGVGAPCGSDTGECAPGVNVCRGGALVCEGGVGPIEEVCDLLDNDCDGAIDEDLALGDACGRSEGICEPGIERCVDGRVICVGAVPPARESCDCLDNDCDGLVDEPPDTGELCPPGSACVDCQCALPCLESEFGFTCPTGKAPRTNDAGECHCVAERCDADACATETYPVGAAEPSCAPDRTDLSHCVCKNNECTFPCDGVVCLDGLVCNPRDPAGRCVDDSCRGLGCVGGLICNAATGECEANPCADVTCPAREACYDGVCGASCGSVTCADGQRCERGACLTDLCDAVTCAGGQICDEDTGLCTADRCVDVRCPAGSVCEGGGCVADPCDRVRCPEGEVCDDGECRARTGPGIDAGPGVDAGVDAGTEALAEGTRVLATGGGGCTCAVPGSGPAEGPLGALLGLLGLVGLIRLRTGGGRGRARPGGGGRGPARRAGWSVLLVVVALALAGLAAGCDVDPFCIDCVDVDAGPDAGPRDSGPVDAGPRDAGPRDGGPVDAGPPDGCVPGAPELCNGLDDDCDGEIDEGIDTDNDVHNCGGCGMACSPPHAFGVCTGGVCGLGGCDVGWHDLNGELEDGCEYRCLQTETDDSLCDLRDNDCDGLVDEDVDFDTDPINCGSCGRVCRFAHASGDCVDGECVLGDCDDGFWDVNPAIPGCEYACTPAVPAVEVCNFVDDDCDGVVDQGNPGGGAICGSTVGECSTGVEQCVDGAIRCVGSVEPTTELCNGLDDDCDGVVDQGNPGGGALCGTGVGTCEQGRQQCIGGTLVCVGAVVPVAELCDGLDNDCDGSIDEGNPEGGGPCGDGTGECTPGTLNCRGGVLVCEGLVGPTTEICNGLDDDCDGLVDEGNPGGGGSCGTDAGECSPGTRQCTGGTLVCVGEVGPTPEVCDALDNDCDGLIDEGNPGGGASCGTDTGACVAGTMTCLGGALVCSGAVGPTTEICNGIDDDCDGMVDEGFVLSSDVNNCGSCGNVCSLANATPRCAAGTCAVASCNTGWVDLNGNPADGCEYACDFAGGEICNGRDDDCDGLVDEGLTPPSNFCNPNGVCASTIASCAGAGGWRCTYPATYEETETSCDGLDNDCDGAVDEPYPTVGTSCSNGVGACRRTGVIACNAAGNGVVCTAPPAGTPLASELCNNLDDDCDGLVDEDIAMSAIPTVSVPRAGGGTVAIMRYEASRPDATATTAGNVETRACSNENVLPWTNVTWTEARNACCALNPSGTCSGGGTGWRLCDAADWQTACSRDGTCTWSYSSGCNASNPTRCNGEEYDCSSAAGDQDCLFPTGSSTFSLCYANWGSGVRVYDMSGNVKEWTNTARGSGVYEIRGGSYNNVEGGRTCDFDFTLGNASFAFPNTGFRCCYY